MVGKYICEIDDVQYAPIKDIENADIAQYRTCRGQTDLNQLLNIFDLVMNPKADEDERMNAICDGLWDLLVHQHTLYSATPVALYYFLKRTNTQDRIKIWDANKFVEVCREQGTKGVFLMNKEIENNIDGNLPIFSIEEVLEKFGLKDESVLSKRVEFEQKSKDINLGIRYFFKKVNRVTCPCCGFPTLGERAMYDICVLCDWEDDGQDEEESSKSFGGPNGKYTLDQARSNFLEFGVMYSPDNNTTITGGDSMLRKKLKADLVSVFNKMLSVDKSKLSKLWGQVLKLEKKLYKELSDSIKKWERANKP